MVLVNNKWAEFDIKQKNEMAKLESEKNSQEAKDKIALDLSQFIPGDELLQLDPSSK